MEAERKYRKLEEKYWAGETNLIEESALLKAINDQPDLFSGELKSVFKTRVSTNNLKLDDDFEREFWEKVEGKSDSKNFIFSDFTKYAAVGILLIGLGYAMTKIFQTEPSVTQPNVAEVNTMEDTYDSPELAFEEAKKALMMASGKLNEGQEKIKEIKRFHHAKKTVMGAADKE